ncbi:hypothetical protein SAMN05216420_1247 [Nitrosospira sp. Nl5]|nr:hypothetical protein SAMN05216420_1247 [Nitrosospira sp. Nl5]
MLHGFFLSSMTPMKPFTVRYHHEDSAREIQAKANEQRKLLEQHEEEQLIWVASAQIKIASTSFDLGNMSKRCDQKWRKRSLIAK